MMKKKKKTQETFLGVLVLEGLVGIHKLVSFSCISDWDIDLDYYDTEWFALEKNQNNSVIFETAPKYCILGSFIDYEDCSIYSKGFFSTILAIRVIWIKFAHSHPF